MNPEHVKHLAEVEHGLPAIIVHRTTGMVIDGMHRLAAARQRGCESILVDFFHGDAEAAFLLAVRINVAHGRPLSTRDREFAVRRVIAAHPDWSDRAIARATGISTRFIGAVRSPPAGPSEPRARIGLDGRARPTDASVGRLRATEFIASNPSASLRSIARAAGISVSTAHDVRQRLTQGRQPLPSRLSGEKEPATVAPHCGATRPDRVDWAEFASVLARMRSDPSLRLKERGRLLVRVIEAHHLRAASWPDFVAEVPPHWLDQVSTLASQLARHWQDFATDLDERAAATRAEAPTVPRQGRSHR